VAASVWQAAEEHAESVMRFRRPRVLPGDVASHVVGRILEPTHATLRGLDILRHPVGVTTWIRTAVEYHLKDLQTIEVNARKTSCQLTDEFNRRLQETPPEIVIRMEDQRTLLAAIDHVRRMGTKAYSRVQAAIALAVEGATARAVANALGKSTGHVRWMAKRGAEALAGAVDQVTDADRERVEPIEIGSGLNFEAEPDRRKRVRRPPLFDRMTREIHEVIESLPRRQREIVEAAYVDRAPMAQIAKQFRLRNPTGTVSRAKQYFLREAKKRGVRLWHRRR